MTKIDTLSTSNTKSSLQELFARARITPEPFTTPRRRRMDNNPSNVSVVESREQATDSTTSTIYQTPPSGVVLEPVSRKPYDLSYACLLIPRFSAHYLIGDVAESLREWMRQICISFSWRLDNIFIRPEYMQWILYVPAATPPSRCIHTIRNHTSRRIFEDFPHIRRENISNDFWAPGYLVLVGPTPHPAEMINEFIYLTRQQQGNQPRLRE